MHLPEPLTLTPQPIVPVTPAPVVVPAPESIVQKSNPQRSRTYLLKLKIKKKGGLLMTNNSLNNCDGN